MVVAGLLALIALVSFQGYDLVALHHEFGVMNFAMGSGSLIGAIAGSKRLRDGPQQGDH